MNSLSNGMTTSSSTPSPSMTSRFTSKGMISFGAASGLITLSGMRVEGQHRVRLVDHGLMALVDAVEDADRHVAVARGRVGELGDLDAHTRTTSGRRFSPSGRATAIRRPSWVRRTCSGGTSNGSGPPSDAVARPPPPPDRPAGARAGTTSAPRRDLDRIAIGHAQPADGGASERSRSRRPRASRSASGRRCPRSTRSRRWRARQSLSSSSARCTMTLRVGVSTDSPRWAFL